MGYARPKKSADDIERKVMSSYFSGKMSHKEMKREMDKLRIRRNKPHYSAIKKD